MSRIVQSANQVGLEEPSGETSLPDFQIKESFDEDENPTAAAVKLNATKMAMIDLVQYCQDQGVSYQFYDSFMQRLKFHQARGVDVSKLPRRHTEVGAQLVGGGRPCQTS